MIKPCNPEVRVWKENTPRKPSWRVKPTSSMMIDKYVRQQQEWACRDKEEGSSSYGQ
jgi:hypothetical protein